MGWEQEAQWFLELKKPTLVGDSFTVTVMKLAVTSVTKTWSKRLCAGRQSVSASESVATLPRLGRLSQGNGAASCSNSLPLLLLLLLLLQLLSESPALISFTLLSFLSSWRPPPELPPLARSFPTLRSPALPEGRAERCGPLADRVSFAPLTLMPLLPLLLSAVRDAAWTLPPPDALLTLWRLSARKLSAWLFRSRDVDTDKAGGLDRPED